MVRLFTNRCNFVHLVIPNRNGMLCTMNLAVKPTERIPLSTGDDGVIRVAGTRVTLDTIAEAFDEGATAEEIAQQYPSVALADIYTVVGYILRHRPDIADYLTQRAEDSATVQQRNQMRSAPQGIRARLLARRTAGK